MTIRRIAGPNPHTRCPQDWRGPRTPEPEIAAAAQTIRVFGRILADQIAEAAPGGGS